MCDANGNWRTILPPKINSHIYISNHLVKASWKLFFFLYIYIFFFFFRKMAFLSFPNKLWGQRILCPRYSNTEHDQEQQLLWILLINSVKYQVLGPVQDDILCGYQGKSVVQLKAFGNVIRKLIGLGELKKLCSSGKYPRMEHAESCWEVWRTFGLEKDN